MEIQHKMHEGSKSKFENENRTNPHAKFGAFSLSSSSSYSKPTVQSPTQRPGAL